MPAVTDVPIAPVSPTRFESVLGDGDYAELAPQIERARGLLRGRVVWHINSSARGGGVAEMLRSHLAYVRGAGVDVRWGVVGGDSAFFTITKRIHNHLHESAGDGGSLDQAAHEAYERTLNRSASYLSEVVKPGDVVFLHDPQTAGLVAAMKKAGAAVLWRCHVGVDRPGEFARGAWRFLLPYIEEADALIFSRRQFVWEGIDEARVWLVPPTIDAFSPKNQELDPPTIEAILRVCGIGEDGEVRGAVFVRSDGTPGRVSRRARVEGEGLVRSDAPMAAQVSRWDRLKDPVGLVSAFSQSVADPAARLLIVGPDVEAVVDDPEGMDVLREVRAARDALPEAERNRIYLVSLPMDDLEENAAMVNAIQRRSQVIVQKSLAEGFGLTVAEAMWKGKPVVAGRVGGIQDQIVDGESGILVDDPADLTAVGRSIAMLLNDPDQAARLGSAARERVTTHFLAIGRILEYFRHIETMIARETPA